MLVHGPRASLCFLPASLAVFLFRCFIPLLRFVSCSLIPALLSSSSLSLVFVSSTSLLLFSFPFHSYFVSFTSLSSIFFPSSLSLLCLLLLSSLDTSLPQSFIPVFSIRLVSFATLSPILFPSLIFISFLPSPSFTGHLVSFFHSCVLYPSLLFQTSVNLPISSFCQLLSRRLIHVSTLPTYLYFIFFTFVERFSAALLLRHFPSLAQLNFILFLSVQFAFRGKTFLLILVSRAKTTKMSTEATHRCSLRPTIYLSSLPPLRFITLSVSIPRGRVLRSYASRATQDEAQDGGGRTHAPVHSGEKYRHGVWDSCDASTSHKYQPQINNNRCNSKKKKKRR